MDLPPGLPVPTVPHVMHLLVLLPGAYVSVDMGQRVRRRSAAER
jgi:hypothetical protein